MCGSTSNASQQGFVDLWCRVNFTGFWPPRMQWMQGYKNLRSEQKRSSASLSSTLTVKAESVGSKTNYTCKTYFVAEDNAFKDEPQFARNVPNYTFIFTSGKEFQRILIEILITISLFLQHTQWYKLQPFINFVLNMYCSDWDKSLINNLISFQILMTILEHPMVT